MSEDALTARLEEFRLRLLGELAEIDRLIEDHVENAAPVELDQQSIGRVSRVDAMQVQAMAQAVERRRTARRQQVANALRRIEEGEFGYCAECGEEIGVKRLEVDPVFAACVKCSR